MLDYSSDSTDLPLFYEPNDDTYVLYEFLYTHNLFKEQKLLNILEIGTGSGYITKKLKEEFPNHFFLQTDINHNIPLINKPDPMYNVMLCDLFNGINQERIDLVVFNPPYVHTKNFNRSEIKYKGIRSSYAGGESGVQVINQFVDSVSVRNVVLLCIEVNKPNEIVERFKNIGYEDCKIVLRRRIMKEVIYIIEARK